ncbi:hypothetical protein [Streptosporangium sp. NPDC048865]|uniref:hypothetical protein n=1 Tax=Streptosporangium sp. NPDC048865 TaxID=3155766 RepID=UPI00341924A5
MTARNSAVLPLSMMAALLVPSLLAPDAFPSSLGAVITAYVVGWIVAMIVICDLVSLANDADRPAEHPKYSVRRFLSVTYAVVATAVVPLAISSRFDSGIATIIGVLIAAVWSWLTFRTLVRFLARASAARKPPPTIPDGCDAYTDLTNLTALCWISIPLPQWSRVLKLGEKVRVGDEHGNRATGRVLGRLRDGVLVDLTTIEHAEPATQRTGATT